MWTYTIKNKISAALLLSAVLIVVILTNFGERSNAKKINTAVVSIYKDRLVVEGYIFNYSRLIQNIEGYIDNTEYSVPTKHGLITESISEIKTLNTLYSETQLTQNEKINFDNFTNLCNVLQNHIMNGHYTQAKATITEANRVLNVLSGIQIAEAKIQMENVSKINSFSTLISHFEMGVLIVIAIMIQILILSSKTLKELKIPDNVHLN